MRFKLTPEISNKIAVWALSGDTGVSSETIACIAMGITDKQCLWHFDTPGDAGDFGRCYRLLNSVPELRDALPLVAEKFPKYAPLVAVWDELTDLYENDPSSCADKIDSLHDACMEAGGWVKTSPYSWKWCGTK